MKHIHKNISSKITFIFIVILLFALPSCSIEIILDGVPLSYHPDLLQVCFIDTGQSDSIFIKTPQGTTMLIDAGNNGDGDKIIDYIKSHGVRDLDVVVGTHPHADHIGALDDIIYAFDIGKIYMPKVTHTSKTYLDVLEAVKETGMKITSAKGGMLIPLDDDVTVEILAPNSNKYESLNNYSVVVRLRYGKNTFLFTGDAEGLSEREMLKKGFDLGADVLKVGHHGSNTSSTEEFLSAVSPKYAVICVGEDNPYGHPHKEVLDRLHHTRAQVYTTMEYGDILMTSDGREITVR